MLLITTSYWIVPTLRRELSYHRYKHFHPFDTWVYTNGWVEEAAYLNLRLRTASKVRIEIGESRRSQTFESLYQRMLSHDRAEYLDEWREITISVHTRQSKLNAWRTIQSVAHKAIIEQRTGNKDGDRFVDTTKKPLEIRIMIDGDKVRIFVNTSGSALHQRGYRTASGEAPLREHIAAALVLMTSRGYSDPFIDPLCGSGTIPIEAAMIASNRAPWLQRAFAWEDFPIAPKWLKEHLIEQAKWKIYEKDYAIQGYDIDPTVLHTANANAVRAWVGQLVSFENKSLFDQIFTDNQTLITNPPYGQRLRWNEVQKIHTTLARESQKTHASTIITWYPESEQLFKGDIWKRKDVKNGGNEVGVYVRR